MLSHICLKFCRLWRKIATQQQQQHSFRDWILLVCFSWRYEATEGGSTCKFRNARSAFRNLHVDPLSLHTFMRNKQVEFNPYIYTLTTLSKLYRFGYEISVFNTKHPVIILRVSLFAVTPSHVASTKIECQNFSYVYRSRKHWECKYYYLNSCISAVVYNLQQAVAEFEYVVYLYYYIRIFQCTQKYIPRNSRIRPP